MVLLLDGNISSLGIYLAEGLIPMDTAFSGSWCSVCRLVFLPADLVLEEHRNSWNPTHRRHNVMGRNAFEELANDHRDMKNANFSIHSRSYKGIRRRADRATSVEYGM